MDVAEVKDFLRRGSSVLKISSGGKPAKRHAFLTDDFTRVKWIPSRKKNEEDFVDIADVAAVKPGKDGSRFERFGAAGDHRDAADFLELRKLAPVEALSGWLEKMGGAKGGRAGWAKRWFVLYGSRLYYYATPADGEPKGWIDLTGATVGPSGEHGRCALSIRWTAGGAGDSAGSDDEGGGLLDGQPPRHLRAESPAGVQKWAAALKRAIRVETSKTGLTMRSGGRGGPHLYASSDEAGGAAQLQDAQPDDGALCFTMHATAGSAAGAKGPISFVAGSPHDYERWYGGLLLLVDAARHGGGGGGKAGAAAREERFKALTAANPHDAVAHVLVGAAAEEAGKLDAALGAYKAGCAAQPLTPSARAAYGRLLLTHKRNAKAALPHLESAVVLTGRGDAGVLRLWARALLATAAELPPQQQHAKGANSKDASAKQAVAALELAAAIDAPAKSVDTEALLGEAWLALGQPGEAVKHLRAALALHYSGEGAGGQQQHGAKAAAAAPAGQPHAIIGHLGDALSAQAGGKGATGPVAHEAAGAYSVAAAHAGSDASAPRDAVSALRRKAFASLSGLGRWREAVAHAEALAAASPDGVAAILDAAAAYFHVERQRTAGSEVLLPGGGGGAAAKAAAGSSKSGKSTRAAADDEEEDDGDAADDEDADGGDDEDAADGDDEEDEDGGRARRKGGKAAKGASSKHAPKAARRRGGSDADPPSSASAAGSSASSAAGGGLPSFDPPPFGSLQPVDGMSPQELVTCSEAHLVRALTLAPESPPANILCARVYERLAEMELAANTTVAAAADAARAKKAAAAAAAAAKAAEESEYDSDDSDDVRRRAKRRAEKAAAAAAAPAPAAADADAGPSVPGDMTADSGWTPNQRLAKAEEWYSYVSAAYADPADAASAGVDASVLVEAPLRLARLLKRRGRFADAATYFKVVVERCAAAPEAASPDGDVTADAARAEAADQAVRCGRLAEGKPEVDPEEEARKAAAADAKAKADADAKRKAKAAKAAAAEEEEMQLLGLGDMSSVPLTPGMTPEERKKAFFKAMQDSKKAKEEEEKARLAAKVAAMTPEERAEHERQTADEERRAKQKDKALTTGLGQYGRGGAANKLLGARGGRGGSARGRGK